MGQVGAYSPHYKTLGPAQRQALNWMRDNFPTTWVEADGRMLDAMRKLRGRFIEIKGDGPGKWMLRLLPSALASEEF